MTSSRVAIVPIELLKRCDGVKRTKPWRCNIYNDGSIHWLNNDGTETGATWSLHDNHTGNYTAIYQWLKHSHKPIFQLIGGE